MTTTFDLIVIGVGMAGNAAARKCANAGWSVTVIDELPYGGTCALRGCDPKKILRRGAEIIDAARLMQGKGIDAGDLRINWTELMAHKRAFTDPVPRKFERGLNSINVETLHGKAEFINENTIEIDGCKKLQGEHILIAAGAKPRPLDVPGGELVIDSTKFLELETLPKRLVFVGGGFVSFEFAHIAARAGSDVVVIDRRARPLPGFDPDMVYRLLERTRDLGINFNAETKLHSISKSDGGFDVSVERAGVTSVMQADAVVHGAGRIAAIDHLQLETGGVSVGPGGGVAVAGHLQSVTNTRVFAAGDAAETPGTPLTPVAVFEGKVAASNMLRGTQIVPDYRGVPSVVFTIPEIVRVGMLEQEANDNGLDYRVSHIDTSGWYSNFRVGETTAASKILTDSNTGQILGAHMIGPEYAELINFFGLAIRLELKAADLKKMVSAYPSVGSDLGAFL